MKCDLRTVKHSLQTHSIRTDRQTVCVLRRHYIARVTSRPDGLHNRSFALVRSLMISFGNAASRSPGAIPLFFFVRIFQWNQTTMRWNRVSKACHFPKILANCVDNMLFHLPRTQTSLFKRARKGRREGDNGRDVWQILFSRWREE